MHTFRKSVLLFLVWTVLPGCTSGAPGKAPTESMTPLRLVMSYRPDVQFTPFYVADARGYFAEEGLKVDFSHLAETESVQLVGVGELEFAVVSAEQVLLARGQELPVVYVLAWWHDFPVAIASAADAGIVSPQDLVGKRLGLPGLYGASYIGFRALIASADIQEQSIQLDSIGYTQVEALYEGREDAVVIYANNEPVQLEALDFPVNVLRVADYVQLASNGLITNEKTLRDNPALVRSMVRAVLRGVRDSIDDPGGAYLIAQEYVEGLSEADESVQRAILDASIEFWEAERLGYSNPEAWSNMQTVLLGMGLLEAPLDLTRAYSNEFLP